MPITVIMDLQAIYPEWMRVKFLRDAMDAYLKMARDPIVAGSLNLIGHPLEFLWLKSFFVLEG